MVKILIENLIKGKIPNNREDFRLVLSNELGADFYAMNHRNVKLPYWLTKP
tara:strand:+ start:542 stop:694 length:153 start_codon:yes stop_codon:yes gene_type:complete